MKLFSQTLTEIASSTKANSSETPFFKPILAADSAKNICFQITHSFCGLKDIRCTSKVHVVCYVVNRRILSIFITNHWQTVFQKGKKNSFQLLVGFEAYNSWPIWCFFSCWILTYLLCNVGKFGEIEKMNIGYIPL